MSNGYVAEVDVPSTRHSLGIYFGRIMLFKYMQRANIESLSCKIGRTAITNPPEKRLHATMGINYATAIIKSVVPCALVNHASRGVSV